MSMARRDAVLGSVIRVTAGPATVQQWEHSIALDTWGDRPLAGLPPVEHLSVVSR